MLSLISVVNVSAQDNQVDEGSILDVNALDSTCLNEESCDAWRPNNLVEYFGADWCEPCREGEDEIDQMNRSKTVIIHHHPSTSDLTFLNHSSIKFDYYYRLLFIPSIVINGNSLLTGSSQALEINQVMDNSTSAFSGIDDITFQNGTLYWNATEGYNLNVWKLENTPHEFENYSHQYLARSHLSFESGNKSANITTWMNNWNGRLVFLLEDPGIVKLTSASYQPTGEIEFNQVDDEGNNISLIDDIKPATLALASGLILFAILLPALIMFHSLSKLDVDDTTSEQE